MLYGAKFTLPYKKSPRTFAIKKFTTKSAADISFVMQGRDGAPSQNISIVNYFQQQFNIRIQKPRLPCIVYGKNFMVP
jgi:eukaryotic translation initiation factor 2C